MAQDRKIFIPKPKQPTDGSFLGGVKKGVSKVGSAIKSAVGAVAEHNDPLGYAKQRNAAATKKLDKLRLKNKISRQNQPGAAAGLRGRVK